MTNVSTNRFLNGLKFHFITKTLVKAQHKIHVEKIKRFSQIVAFFAMNTLSLTRGLSKTSSFHGSPQVLPKGIKGSEQHIWKGFSNYFKFDKKFGHNYYIFFVNYASLGNHFEICGTLMRVKIYKCVTTEE